MKRTLRALRFRLYIPRRGGCELGVGIDSPAPKGCKPLSRGEWCDLRAEDRVVFDGRSWYVGQVLLEDSDPLPPERAVVQSGRHWLATGECRPNPRIVGSARSLQTFAAGHFAPTVTAGQREDMPRVLRSLRISIRLPGRPHPWQALVGVGRKPEIATAPPGLPFCNLTAGSNVDTRTRGIREVVAIQIEDAEPPDQRGRIVTSGRAWLRGE